MISMKPIGVNYMNVMLCPSAVVASPICPLVLCRQEMQLETSRYTAGYDSKTGLCCFRCPACGHIGMVAAGGVQLVFRLAHKYVLTYDPYPSAMTVVLPAHSIALCQTYGFDADELAKQAAEWALLSGNSSDTLTLVPGRQEFLAFTDYLGSLALPTLCDLPLTRPSNEGQATAEELASV